MEHKQMQISPWPYGRGVLSCLLALACILQPALLAQTHVVSPAELQSAAADATKARQRNADTVAGFLSSPTAEKALRSAQMDPAQVKDAVSSLNDEELAHLASRARQAQSDFAAGRLSDRDLLILVLGIAALILIIVAVR